MLYIYHVDVGHMFAFDMNYATKKVRDLKKEIERSCLIPYVNQVLVVSGGQIMDGKRVVGSYQAGTDNNPVWLVDNRLYNQNQAPKAYIPEGPDDRLVDFLQKSMNLPPTYETIETRAHLSMRFHENARHEYKICETLVKDQHFQHQGWAALKCTLEDKGTAMEKNKNLFLKAYDQFLQEREPAMNQLQQYDKTRMLIEKIPIPKCLDHYAKKYTDMMKHSMFVHKCSDKLWKNVTSTTAERKISNFVSCVDKLEKSEYSSGSGPPSSHFQGMSDSTEKQQDETSVTVTTVAAAASPVGKRRSSSPMLIKRSSQDSVAGSDASSSQDSNRLPSSNSGTPLLRRETSPGFTSPEIQSPCVTPKRLSHISEEEGGNIDNTTTRTIRFYAQGGSGGYGPLPINKDIRFEISPSGSQISQSSSSQLSEQELRSLSPSPCQMKTLLDWIRGNDSKDPIEMVKKELDEKFMRLTPDLRGELVSKCIDALKSLDNKSMKEFKGLDRRLAGLEQLMMQMKNLVRQQSDMAQGFIQNQQRAKSVRDASVLPDLCSSHRKQLEVIYEQYQKICDIKRRITAAKQELCTVLHARMRWIMHMEEKLREVDNEIIMTQGMLGRMFSYMKTLNQVHETPALFAEAVVEGYRRITFSARYKAWAENLAEENRTLYQKEIERRQLFNQHLSGHFLLRMFTGYGEEPPDFATKAPDPFDTELPAITAEDIELLRQEVPEIAHILVIPDETDVGKNISSNTLRGGTSSTIFVPTLQQQREELTTSGSPVNATYTTTTDQATSTSFCLTGSIQDDNNSDIVVLNANGEQGVLTPSPEHKSAPVSSSSTTTVMAGVDNATAQSLHDEKSSQLKHRPESIVTVDPSSRRISEIVDTDLTQSVEVISNDDAGDDHDNRFTLPFDRYAGRGDDPRSISVQEPRSIDESPSDGELHFHSLRSLSLDEVRLNSGDFKCGQLGGSPDLDDYATADFYIDESIPSAMSASSPDRTIAELHLQLEEKVNEIERLQTVKVESAENKEKYERLNLTISAVQQALEKLKGSEVVLLRDQLSSLREDTVQQRDQLEMDVSQMYDNISQCIVSISEDSQRKSEEWENKFKCANEEFSQEKCKYDETITDLKKQLASENKKLVSMQMEHDEKQTASNQEKEKFEEKFKIVENEKEAIETNLAIENEKLQAADKKICEMEQQVVSLQEKLDKLTEMKVDLEKKLKTDEESYKLEIKELNEEHTKQLHTEKETCLSLQTTVKELEHNLQDKTMEFDKKKQENEVEIAKLEEKLKNLETESEAKVKELNEKLDSEVADMKSQLILEHEVEMDKVRSDLEIEVMEKEQEIEKMKADLESVNKTLENLKIEKEKLHEELQTQFQEEKEQIKLILEKDMMEKMEEKESVLRETLEKDREARLDQALKEKDEEHIKLVNKAKAELKEEHLAKIEDIKAQHQKDMEDQYLKNEERLDEVRKELEAQFNTQREKERTQFSESSKEVISAVEAEKEKEVQEIRESLSFDFQKTIRELKVDIENKNQEIEELKEGLKGKESQLSKIKDDPNLLTLEKHESIISEMKSEMEKQNADDIKMALKEKDAQHREEIDTLLEKMQKDKQDSLDQMKTSLTGEKQVLFNEALNKVVADKDRVIEELKQKHGETETKLDKVKTEMSHLKTKLSDTKKTRDQYKASLSKSDDKESTESRAKRKEYEEEIRSLKQQLMMMSSTSSSMMTSSVMTQSVVAVSEAGTLQDRIALLESELKTKEEEITKLKLKLQEKMGELSMSPATQSLVKDKISITSCSKGDVVLLCLDDKYDHYVVFTVGTTLHFLHSDCLEALNLKPTPGEQQRLWVLAEIVEKEYCQAKKAQNRFKVPVGTKFYRVRCKPWSPTSMIPTIGPRTTGGTGPSSSSSSKRQLMQQQKQQPGAAAAAADSDKPSSIDIADEKTVVDDDREKVVKHEEGESNKSSDGVKTEENTGSDRSNVKDDDSNSTNDSRKEKR